MLQGFNPFGSVPVKFAEDICIFKTRDIYAAALVYEQNADSTNSTNLVMFIEKVMSHFKSFLFDMIT